jgi:hypothetical protein
VSRLRALRLLPLLLAAVVAGGAAGAVEARPVATAPNDAAMEKLERIVRARVDSRRTTGIVAGSLRKMRRRNDPFSEPFPPSQHVSPANRDLVEAAGIEPASADAPDKASTSVVWALISPGGRFPDDLPTG